MQRYLKLAFSQVPAITVVLAGYMGCNADAAIIMFTISIGFLGMTVPGSKSSMLDFAPKYSGKYFFEDSNSGPIDLSAKYCLA